MTWIWDAGNNNKNYTGGAWPGQSMWRTTIDGTEYWTFTFSSTDNLLQPMIIFNNGSGGNGNQTADLVYENYAVYDRVGVIGSIKPNSNIENNIENDEIIYNHRTIMAQGRILVYNTQGMLVVTGTEQVTVPESGLYIVVTDKKVDKKLLY